MRTAFPVLLATVPVAVALAVLPRPALVVWVGLGVLAGVLAGMWVRFAEDGPAASARLIGLRTAGAVAAGGLALAGTALLAGAATPWLVAVPAGGWLVARSARSLRTAREDATP